MVVVPPGAFLVGAVTPEGRAGIDDELEAGLLSLTGDVPNLFTFASGLPVICSMPLGFNSSMENINPVIWSFTFPASRTRFLKAMGK